MSKYIAVDCGKYETKVAVCDDSERSYREFKFRTKMDQGRFDDDMLGRGTYIAEIDGGKVVRIGADATIETEKVTSKSDEMHRSATLLAIALAIGKPGKEDVTVAIGVPYTICADVEARNKYKEYMLPDGAEHTVKVKRTAAEEPYTVSFKVIKRYVYPESIGAMYEFPEKFMEVAGIIDIGNVNRGGTYINTRSIAQNYSFTDEHGGQDLVSSLADKLTVEMGARCTVDLVAKVLTKPYEKRYLVNKTGDKTLEEKSRKVIDAHLKEYASGVKKLCDTRTWPLDFMELVAIGGTAQLLRRELTEVFGQSIYIPENPEKINARGFLARICADNNIDLESIKNDKNKKKPDSKTA